MLANQETNPQKNNPARTLNDVADKMLLTFILWQSAREQNNRKLQEHLEKLKKYGGLPPKKLEHA